MGRGLPPITPGDIPTGDGGGFERRDDDYWKSHRLTEGTYEFVAFVSKIIWWGPDGPTVMFVVSDWDRAANRPRANHGRPIPWPQFMTAPMMERMSEANRDEEDRATARRAYGYHMKYLMAAYAACGMPYETWPKDADGNPEPPFHAFFVHPHPSGAFVPVMLRIKVVVQRGREGFPPSVREVSIVPGPVQAPAPRDVMPAIAEMYNWSVQETRTLDMKGKSVAPGGYAYTYEPYSVDIAVLAKDAVPPQHGMKNYKDL